MTVYQSWKPGEVPLHTFEQRLDMIAGGRITPPGERALCRYKPPLSLLPARAVRVAIIEALRAEVERVDGDGLLPRAARRQSWPETIAVLKDEAAQAVSPEELGRVLKRFDASIPNHHMRGYLREAFEPYSRPDAPFSAAAESVFDETPPLRYRVASVSSASWNSADAPRPGDELLAINGRAMSKWSDENFNFCKSPLRSQCERQLSESLWNELLSWKRPEPLTLSLRRAGRSWDAAVPEPKYSPPPLRSDDRPQPRCGVQDGRYPGFSAAYLGANACVFSSERHPGVFVLRIPSFRYEHDKEADIDSIQKELRHLYEGFWKTRSSEIKFLIVDVIGNHGGADPIAYYRLLFKAPFQEQHVQYKKISELNGDGQDARRLWDSAWANEHWLASIRKDGRLAKTPIGGFLPNRPQFCADEQDCEHALFTPLEHRFDGRVLLLLDRQCVSSCVGFAWNLVDVLKDRVRTFGEPDSGDSTFARLFLDVILDPTIRACGPDRLVSAAPAS